MEIKKKRFQVYESQTLKNKTVELPPELGEQNSGLESSQKQSVKVWGKAGRGTKRMQLVLRLEGGGGAWIRRSYACEHRVSIS